MARLQRIIQLNRWLKDAKETKNIKHYEELVLKIHRLEIEDKVPINSYCIRL